MRGVTCAFEQYVDLCCVLSRSPSEKSVWGGLRGMPLPSWESDRSTPNLFSVFFCQCLFMLNRRVKLCSFTSSSVACLQDTLKVPGMSADSFVLDWNCTELSLQWRQEKVFVSTGNSGNGSVALEVAWCGLCFVGLWNRVVLCCMTFFSTEVIVPLCEQDLLRCLDSK